MKVKILTRINSNIAIGAMAGYFGMTTTTINSSAITSVEKRKKLALDQNL